MLLIPQVKIILCKTSGTLRPHEILLRSNLHLVRSVCICRKSVQTKMSFQIILLLKHNQISSRSSPGIVEVLGPWPVPVAAVVRDPTAGARIKSMSPSFSKQNSRMYINI